MKISFLLFMFFYVTKSNAQLPVVSSGIVKRIDSLQSKFISPPNIDVWLPEGYTTEKKYAVLYMHDGQMLFDSSITWNHQEWHADEIAGKLIRENNIKEIIIVGIQLFVWYKCWYLGV